MALVRCFDVLNFLEKTQHGKLASRDKSNNNRNHPWPYALLLYQLKRQEDVGSESSRYMTYIFKHLLHTEHFPLAMFS